jgi:MFS family permease
MIHFVFALAIFNGVIPNAARVLLALYALELGARPVTVGALAAVFSLLPMLLSVPAGKFADRHGARVLLMLVGCVGALGMMAPYFVPSLAMVFVAALLLGMSDGLFSVSMQNLVGVFSTPQTRAANFTNYALTGSVGNLVGPLLAGFATDLIGHRAACLMLGLMAVVPVLMLLIRGGRLRGGARTAAPEGKGWRDLLAAPGVRRTLASTSLLNTGQDLYKFHMPVYMHAIPLSASTIGMVLAMNSVASMAVRMVLPRLIARFTERRVLACAFYIGASSLALIPLFESALLLAAVSFVFGLGFGCGQPIITMLMFANSPLGRSGEAMGLRMSVLHLTRLAGPVAFGAAASVVCLAAMFWLNAAMMTVGGRLSRAG